MHPDLLARAALFVGHSAILVWAINVAHGVGFNDRGKDRWKMAGLALLLLALGGWGAASFAQGGWSAWSWPVRGYAVACLAIAAVGLPVSTLNRARRGMPEGIAEASRDHDLAALEGAAALIGDGRRAWLLRVPGNESLRLRERSWDVPLANLPDAWDGLRILQLTDLHFAPAFRRRFFERVVERAADGEADLVLFTGDLVDDDDVLDWIVPVLSGVRGRLGTYGILGNHDYGHPSARILELMEEAGFTSLEGRWTRIEVAGRSLAIGGTSAPWGPRLDLRAHADADFRLLLSHSPDLFYRAADAGIDLMLSGHNHGGQVRLPVLGPVLMPSLYSRRFDRGFFRSGRTLMHVGQGVGAKHPIRFGCVPEIGRFVLRAKGTAGSPKSLGKISRPLGGRIGSPASEAPSGDQR